MTIDVKFLRYKSCWLIIFSQTPLNFQFRGSTSLVTLILVPYYDLLALQPVEVKQICGQTLDIMLYQLKRETIFKCDLI